MPLYACVSASKGKVLVQGRATQGGSGGDYGWGEPGEWEGEPEEEKGAKTEVESGGGGGSGWMRERRDRR